MENIILSGVTIKDFLLKIEELIDKKINAGGELARPDQTNYFTRKETAAFLKISLPTLNTWTKDSLLQSYRIGNRVLYQQEEIKNSLHKILFNKHKKYRL